VQNQRKLLADKEKSNLEEKLRKLSDMIEQLKTAGAFAIKGPKAANDWDIKIKLWDEVLDQAIQEQAAVVKGPQLFPAAQSSLYKFMTEMLGARNALDLAAKSGLKTMQEKYKVGPGQLWSNLNREFDKLRGELQVLGAPQISSINEQLIRERMQSEE
jgi:hypothetical protein